MAKLECGIRLGLEPHFACGIGAVSPSAVVTFRLGLLYFGNGGEARPFLTNPHHHVRWSILPLELKYHPPTRQAVHLSLSGFAPRVPLMAPHYLTG